MSRKVPSFDQLIDYMDLGASSREHNIYYNLYSRKPEDIYTEFSQNSRFLPKRKNGVFMYHEVISITRSNLLSEAQQIEILRKVIYQYIQDRAGQNLVYGVLHDEKVDNLHYHLLISSNHLESQKRHRLSKADFDKIKRNLETYVLECFPELQQKKLISRSQEEKQATEGLSNSGVELKRRTGKTPQRDIVRDTLLHIFSTAKNHEQLIELLESENLKLYKRGQHWGVVNEQTKRKHRFTTLGVNDAFLSLEKSIQDSFIQKPDKPLQDEQQTTDLQTEKNAADSFKNKKHDPDFQQEQSESETSKHLTEKTATDSISDEAEKRLSEIKKQRKNKENKQADFKKRQ